MALHISDSASLKLIQQRECVMQVWTSSSVGSRPKSEVLCVVTHAYKNALDTVWVDAAGLHGLNSEDTRRVG